MTTESVDIQYLTTAELAGLLRTRALSPVGVTRAQLERVDALDGRVASFCHLTAEAAFDAARRVSERRNDIGSSRAWP
jgi:Asp-tRNA(Asn)/Glu-tRNA(Gln) amidotransferase A subunit family amidase